MQLLSNRLGVAKSNTTREPNTTNPFINRLWIEDKRVWVIFGVDMTNLFNKRVEFMFGMQTHLTRLAYKVISYFDIITKFVVVFAGKLNLVDRINKF